MEMNDFETGLLATSRQVAYCLFGWPCRVASGRVGGLLFRTHSEQRARASRGRLLLQRAPQDIAGRELLITPQTSHLH